MRNTFDFLVRNAAAHMSSKYCLCSNCNTMAGIHNLNLGRMNVTAGHLNKMYNVAYRQRLQCTIVCRSVSKRSIASIDGESPSKGKNPPTYLLSSPLKKILQICSLKTEKREQKIEINAALFQKFEIFLPFPLSPPAPLFHPTPPLRPVYLPPLKTLTLNP